MPNVLSDTISDLPEFGYDGYIEKVEGKTVILVRTDSNTALRAEGVQCLNPEAEPDKRIVRKVFTNKRIYLPDEYSLAVKNELKKNDRCFVPSMNGFTKIEAPELVKWGLEKGDYESACENLFDTLILALQERFKGIKIIPIDGGSKLGIDLALLNVIKKHNLDSLSFSCPRWMLYVEDDNKPVFVGKDANDYADRYIQSLDFLVCTGGREQALKHDVYGATLYNKRIHFIDVVGAISRNASKASGVSVDATGKRKIENAAAAFINSISLSVSGGSMTTMGVWDNIRHDVSRQIIECCANFMPHDVKFKTGKY